MMDYPVWRKKPQTPETINFMRSYRLDQTHPDDVAKQQSVRLFPIYLERVPFQAMYCC